MYIDKPIIIIKRCTGEKRRAKHKKKSKNSIQISSDQQLLNSS